MHLRKRRELLKTDTTTPIVVKLALTIFGTNVILRQTYSLFYKLLIKFSCSITMAIVN